MSEPKPMSGAELLKKIRPRLREDAVQVCLRPDLIEAWQDAEDALAEASARTMTAPARLSKKPAEAVDQRALAEQVQKLEAEIAAASVWFRFRALPQDQWRDLCDNHPPRDGDQLDIFAGYNRAAVMDRAVRDCLIDPVFDDDSWAELTAVISNGEWEELRKTVASVNRDAVELPKSVLASRVLTPLDSANE